MEKMFELEDRTYISQDRKKVVTLQEKCPEGRVLLGVKGAKIPWSQAVDLGLAKGSPEAKEKKSPASTKEKKPSASK